MEGGQAAANDFLCLVDDALQPVSLSLSLGSLAEPDQYGGGQDGTDDGSVKLHQHSLWQFEFFKLPQKVESQLSLFMDGKCNAPGCQLLYHLLVGRLIIVMDEDDRCRVRSLTEGLVVKS